MRLYTKEGMLLLVQLDHLDGEALGYIVDRFYETGAKNVQIVNTITKKNRPGHMIYIDAPMDSLEELEELIVTECGSSGWHRIPTAHRHTRVSVLSMDVRIQAAENTYDFTIQGKVIDDDFRNARPEYENCVRLRELLLEKEGISVPLRKIQACLARIFSEETEKCMIYDGSGSGRVIAINKRTQHEETQ
ncbi:MAG: DUF111 family protein [Clostridiales bacterium]|nr:DUF111 family protein [Clostridiales bacterium]